MAGAYVQSAQTSSGNTSFTIVINGVTAGNTLLIWQWAGSASAFTFPTPTDASNTWHSGIPFTGLGNNNHVQSFYTYNAASGNTTITVGNTINTTTTFVVVFEISGLTTTDPFDKQAVADAANTTAYASGNTASISQANEYLVGLGMSGFNSYTYTAGSSYTIQKQALISANSYYYEDQNVSSVAAYAANATASASTSSRGAAGIMTFKLPSAAATISMLASMGAG